MNKRKYLIISIVAVLTLIVATILAIGNIATTSTNIKQGRKIMSNSSTIGSKGTIINVPIDCRPAGTTEFGDLVEAAGYKYIEINRSLDTYQGTDGNKYIKGTASLEQSALEQQVKENNSSDTTVIINLSTYFFGGIKATRDPDNYSEETMQSNLQTLKNLISTYSKPTYYVSMSIPRTLPDFDFDGLSGGVSSSKTVAGLSGDNETFEQAFMDWQYLHYIQNWKGSTSWLPDKVETWAVNFKNTYKTQTEAYLKIYDTVYNYINNSTIGLSKLAKDLGFELIINTESNALPDSIANENIDSEYISNEVPKTYYWTLDDNGNKIGYSGLKYCADAALTNYSALTVIHGVENVNDVILAREIARNNNVKISYNYIEPLTGNTWSNASGSALNFEDIYDELTETEILTERTNFINKDRGSGSLTVDLYVTNKAHTLSGGEEETFIDTVTQTSSADATGILDLKNLGNSTEYYDALISYDAIFKNPVYVDLSAITNSTSKALATTAVYASLQKDFKNATTISDELKSRLSKFSEIQLRNVLVDGVYYKKIKESGNYTVNSSDLKNRIIMSDGTTSSSSSNKNLINMMQNTEMSIAGNSYKVNNVSVTKATNPLNRDYEVLLESDVGTLNISSANATTITITPKNPEIKVGETVQLKATISPETDTSITWTSSSDEYATVDSTGKVTAKKVGSVKIKAIASNGVEGSTIVEIKENSEGTIKVGNSLKIAPSWIEMEKGGHWKVSAMTNDNEKIDESVLIWTSDNESVATVDDDGTINGIGVGKATITAKTTQAFNSQIFTSTCEVSIVEEAKKVTSVDVTPKNGTVKVDETLQLTATTSPITDTNITWSSASDTIATVDSTGKVTGVKEGTVVITATSSNGVEGTTTVEVKAKGETSIVVTSVDITPKNGTVKVGETLQLTATTSPITDINITWLSASDTIATVDSTGKVTGVKEGTVVITATSSNGVKGIVTIQVEDKGTTPGGNTNTNPGENTNTTPGGNTNTNPGENTNTTPGGNTNITPNGNNTTPSGSTNTTTSGNTSINNNTTTISGNANSGNSNSGTASTLPYTGFLNRDLGILLTIIVASIMVGVTSFIKYKKIKIK